MADQTFESRAERLAERMQRPGDEAAFTDFVELFAPRLEAFFRWRGLSADDAKDATQNCFMSVILGVASGKYQFQREGGFASWVFSIAYRELSNRYRRQLPCEPLEDHTDKLPAAPAPDEQVDLDAPGPRVLALRQAIIELSPPLRAVVELRLSHPQPSFQEIGQRLGIRNGTARTRWTRACEELERLLRPDD